VHPLHVGLNRRHVRTSGQTTDGTDAACNWQYITRIPKQIMPALSSGAPTMPTDRDFSHPRERGEVEEVGGFLFAKSLGLGPITGMAVSLGSNRRVLLRFRSGAGDRSRSDYC
jgi:hypothetical protein